MKHYSVMGVKETLYVDGVVHEGDWHIDSEGVEDGRDAQFFSVNERQGDNSGVWLADFYRREDAELFISAKTNKDEGGK